MSRIDQEYIFYKMLDVDKNISLVKSRKDSEIYVQKEYQFYSADVFKRLTQLNISGIPKIKDFEEVHEKLIIVEEYIKGNDCNNLFTEMGPFDEKLVVNISLQLCDILSVLHNQNPPIVHRDIKPSNLILVKNNIYLIDFNASREYKEGYSEDTNLAYTKNFAAPEQYGFSQSDKTTDIYGIGSTMNYLLIGMTPNRMIFPGMTGKIWSKCTNIDFKQRYQSVDELKKDLLDISRQL